MDDYDDDEMSAEEIAAAIAAALVEDDEDTVVPPTPWAQLDTSAVAFVFAAQISTAAADLFRNLATLALGQSAHDWAEQDARSFSENMLRSLDLIPTKEPETSEGGGE